MWCYSLVHNVVVDNAQHHPPEQPQQVRVPQHCGCVNVRVDLLSLQNNYQLLLVSSIRTKLCYDNIIVYGPCIVESTSSVGQSGQVHAQTLDGLEVPSPYQTRSKVYPSR
jgi:hypothetical protein